MSNSNLATTLCEMAEMARGVMVTVRFDAHTALCLREAAEKRGVSRAALVRDLVETSSQMRSTIVKGPQILRDIKSAAPDLHKLAHMAAALDDRPAPKLVPKPRHRTACIVTGCTHPSKGPRFHYLCNRHRRAPLVRVRRWQTEHAARTPEERATWIAATIGLNEGA